MTSRRRSRRVDSAPARSGLDPSRGKLAAGGGSKFWTFGAQRSRGQAGTQRSGKPRSVWMGEARRSLNRMRSNERTSLSLSVTGAQSRKYMQIQVPARVSVLVTDLDNTLWDWFELWYCSFKPFLDSLVKTLGISEETLKAQIKEIHQKHHTSEYSLLLQELPCVREHVGEGFDPYEHFSDVIKAFREGRKKASVLYPTVFDTLQKIHGRGTIIVGFTESQFFYTTQRIRTLGLDGVIDVLYTTQDQGLPPLDELRQLRNKPDSYYDLHKTRTSHLPIHALKPDPELLSMILKDLHATPDDAIYVGDNLYKDILMAKQTGVCAVHAAYGESHRDSRYELLRDVTHWRTNDVAREKTAKEDGIQPDYVLRQSFDELLQIFNFVEYKQI